ncbi:MAG: YXWGXW repeat-containing protein [Janthinobacterium lividum]
MMNTTRAALACGILLLAGCVGQPVVASYPPVPAARVEVIPPPPPEREQVHWQPGHWHWDGYGYRWLPGRYVVRVVGAMRWVEGHWATRPQGYVWVAGHWA